MLKPVLQLLLATFCHTAALNAQCLATDNFAENFWLNNMPSQPGIANETYRLDAWGDEFYRIPVVAGNTYYFRTCFPENISPTNINTILSLHSNTNTLLVWNDNFCGQQSQISWTATYTGQARLSFNIDNCGLLITTSTKIGIYYTAACTAPSVSQSPSAANACLGGTASFSVVAAGTGITYQWQVNTGSGFASINNNSTYSNATTSTLSVSGITALLNGYQYRCVVTGTCGSATSTAAALNVSSTNTWTGAAANNNWHTAGNWSCNQVPTPLHDVVVSTGVPTIAAGATAQCRNLSKSGFLSTIGLQNATLQIFGNLTYNGGSFSTNSNSSIQFTGSTKQTIGGVTPLSISNMVINNPQDVVLNNHANILGTLTLQTGKLFSNDNLLTVNNFANASSANYVVTGSDAGVPATTNGIKTSIGAGLSKQLPIGPTSSSYNPITITNSSGPAEDFTVRVNQTAPPGFLQQASVGNTWQIDEATLGSNTVTLRLQWNQNNEGASFTRQNCSLYKSDGVNAIDQDGYTPQIGAATNAGGSSWYHDLAGITELSPWGISNGIVTLPLRFVHFTAQPNKRQQVALQWSIDEVETAASMWITRSSHNQRFDTLAKLEGQSLHTTAYLDQLPLPGRSLYRLVIQSKNGRTHFSNLASVNLGSISQSILLIPNPAVSNSSLIFNSQTPQIAHIRVYTATGTLQQYQMVTLAEGRNTVLLQTSGWKAGVYSVVLFTANGIQFHSKLIKH
ncbi:MAG: T9SS C-terminal target domain-containing protein [Bacteroidetes bacterium]|nr:MAG: T9SS C-terminal target domain-containing protein [Bacteroidota bacterium]